ncbi:amino acid ABC transporter permease [Caballeronia sp. 15711]|uniref:amino acid ABC transporter permease n=1 Tax=Caballeronia sp. 15711 TaxID=3391029 RepID=UPI0039E6B52D
MTFLGLHEIVASLPYLLKVGMTFSLTLTGLAAVFGLMLGTLLALCRMSPSKLLSVPATFYVNGMRSIPLLLVIFWFYFLAPYVGAWITHSSTPVEVGAYRSAVVTFTLFESAYFCEIMRAGIASISRGQMQAGLALGLSYQQTMLSVVLPQALRNMTPALLTRVITLFQDTSLVYVLSMTDFFGAASEIAARDGSTVQMYVFAAAVYFAICFGASRLVKRFETARHAH